MKKDKILIIGARRQIGTELTVALNRSFPAFNIFYVCNASFQFMTTHFFITYLVLLNGPLRFIAPLFLFHNKLIAL
jgi:hypothetical protein